MNRAQGGTRSLPDGFLHIQNFTVTKASGMAGCVYVHVMTDNERTAVEAVLVSRAEALQEISGVEVCHFKHGVWRFRKSFLKENFVKVVHTTTRLTVSPIIERFKQKLFAEREATFGGWVGKI